jgi:hypothetical protein
MLTEGTKVKSIRQAVKTSTNGRICLDILSIDSPEMAEATVSGCVPARGRKRSSGGSS